MDQALAGLRILEIGDDVAVRYLGHLFAALGAEVVRTSPPRDDGIGYGGALGEAYGIWLDARKRRSATPQGRFDVVVGGLAPSAVAAAEAAQARLGGLLVALTWFGAEGPYAQWRGADELVAALNGMTYQFGEPGGPPTLAQGHIPQVTAAVVAFSAAVAAPLPAAQLRPARLDVNVFEASLCYMETAALGGLHAGDTSVRLGVNRFVPTYPASPYRAADGWIGVTCLTPAQWRALCRLMDREDLANDPRFETTYDRLLLGDDVDAELAPQFLRRTQAEWVALGMRDRIPIAPMDPPGRLPDVGHWRDRGAFADFGLPGVLGPALPFRLAFDGCRETLPEGAASRAPLAGLRVADFSMGWAGPLCSRTLGDLGADVIKIESSTHPDWWRGWEEGADVDLLEGRVNFVNVNRNKRGVDLDLTSAAGKTAAKAILARSDVVVENFAAGVLDKLGLGPAVQRALRPGVVSLSMPAFGNGGPLSALRAYGSTVEQASGLPFINGEPQWPPAQQHIALGDPIAGLYAVAAIVAALHARERLGGVDVDLAQVAALFHLGADAIIAEQLRDEPLRRSGSARPRLALCAVVESADRDGWLALAARDAGDLAALEGVSGGRDLDTLRTWASGRSSAAAAAELQARGIPAAPVQRASGIGSDPHLQATGYFDQMDRPVIGRHPVTRSPFRFDGERLPLGRTAPRLGEHTLEVLRDVGALQPATN